MEKVCVKQAQRVRFRLRQTHQVLVPCHQDCVQHGLVKKEVPHPLGDDNVDFSIRT